MVPQENVDKVLFWLMNLWSEVVFETPTLLRHTGMASPEFNSELDLRPYANGERI